MSSERVKYQTSGHTSNCACTRCRGVGPRDARACTGTCERCKLKIRTAEYHDSDGLFCEPCHQLNEVQAERDELRKDVEGLNRMLREHGYGQGQIDCYVQTAEELDEAVGLLDGCRAVLSQVENDAWTTNTLTYGRARQVQAQMNTVAAFLARLRAASQGVPSQEQPQTPARKGGE